MTATLFPEATMAKPPSTTDLKMRVGIVKNTGRLNGRHKYIDVALAHDRTLDTIKGGNHIRNVWSMRTADLGLTQAWEKAAGIHPPAEPA